MKVHRGSEPCSEFISFPQDQAYLNVVAECHNASTISRIVEKNINLRAIFEL